MVERKIKIERIVGRSVASALAVAILKEQIKRTGRLEIPDLGIEFGPDDLLDEKLRDAIRKRENAPPEPPLGR